MREINCQIFPVFMYIVYFYFIFHKIVLKFSKICQLAGNTMEFGKLLTELRKEKGVLQKDVAEHLNMTVSTISNYEKGVHMPDLHTLIMLADYFDVSTDYLLQRTNYKASLNTLSYKLSDDYTVSDFINTVVELDTRNMQALLDYYELLMLRNSIKRVK